LSGSRWRPWGQTPVPQKKNNSDIIETWLALQPEKPINFLCNLWEVIFASQNLSFLICKMGRRMFFLGITVKLTCA
jgi:hypothetical protein